MLKRFSVQIFIFTLLISNPLSASQFLTQKSGQLRQLSGFQKYLFLESWSAEGEKVRAKGFGVGGIFGWQSSDDSLNLGNREPFLIKASGGFRVQTGSNNSLNLKEYAPNREWFLEEAILRWRPNLAKSLFFHFDIGAINQSWVNSKMLVAPDAFMGAFQRIHWSFSDRFPQTGMTLLGQQTIPYNQNLNSRAGGIEEGTPRFFTHGAQVTLVNSVVQSQFRSLYFEFDNLSSDVAGQSQFMGNEVTGISPKFDFLYGFQGWHHRFDFGLWNKFTLWGEYIFNDKAPDSSNTGSHFGTKFHFGNNLKVNTSYFRLEKNASVGYYNDKRIGHNNKKGFLVDLLFKNIDFKEDLRFDLSLNYAHAEVIDKTQLLDAPIDLFGFFMLLPFDFDL